jgi:hypothetical protein
VSASARLRPHTPGWAQTPRHCCDRRSYSPRTDVRAQYPVATRCTPTGRANRPASPNQRHHHHTSPVARHWPLPSRPRHRTPPPPPRCMHIPQSCLLLLHASWSIKSSLVPAPHNTECGRRWRRCCGTPLHPRLQHRLRLRKVSVHPTEAPPAVFCLVLRPYSLEQKLLWLPNHGTTELARRSTSRRLQPLKSTLGESLIIPGHFPRPIPAVPWPDSGDPRCWPHPGTQLQKLNST